MRIWSTPGAFAVLAGLSLFGASGCVFEGPDHGYGGYRGNYDYSYGGSYHESHMPNGNGYNNGYGQGYPSGHYKKYQPNGDGDGNGHGGYGD